MEWPKRRKQCWAVDFGLKLAIVLSTDSDVKKRYLTACFPFTRQSDRLLDIIQVLLDTCRHLAFDSYHPVVTQERAVVKSLTDLAKNIPSSSDEQSKEMKYVTFSRSPANNLQQLHRTPLITCAYYHTSRQYTRTDQANFEQLWPEIKVALKPYQTISILFPKPKVLSQNQMCGAIYLIPRQHCDKIYIRETKHKFASRLKEHRTRKQ